MMNSTIAHRLVPLVLAGLPLALAGCTSGSPDAEPLGKTDAPLAAPASGPVRQISVRSPFGDIAATRNLVLDGDFELSQGGGEGWFAYNPDGSFTLTFQTGGQCRSGLNCADTPAGGALYAEWVAIRPGSAGTFTFAARPSSGACGDVHGELDLSVDAFGAVFDAFVAQPDSATPRSDGWCTYTGHYSAEQPLYQWTSLYLSPACEALFDDAVALEAPEMREIARGERRAGDPEQGRLHAARRRLAREAAQRAAPEILKPRRGTSARAGGKGAR
jgi:hypothetical protein